MLLKESLEEGRRKRSTVVEGVRGTSKAFGDAEPIASQVNVYSCYPPRIDDNPVTLMSLYNVFPLAVKLKILGNLISP